MRTVHKAILTIGRTTLLIPRNAQVLTAQWQAGLLTLWYDYETDDPVEKRTFDVFGTGHLLPSTLMQYIATVQDSAGYVWHVYEVML
jgi:hypothetical protein